jgi:hypothetical protein
MKKPDILEYSDELAKKIAGVYGYDYVGEKPIYESDNPRAKQAWRATVEAYYHINAVDLTDVLDDYEDEKE